MQLKADKTIKWADSKVPSDINLENVYLGPDPKGLGGFQVAVATSSNTPTRPVLKDLFSARKGKTQVQLVVAVVHGETVHLFGPDPQAQPIVLSQDRAERQLQSVLSEPDVLAATERFAGFRKAHDSTSVSGFTNSGLFATHHIKNNVPQRADWAKLGEKARPMLTKRNVELIEALGFTATKGSNNTFTLSSSGAHPRAVAILLKEDEHFDSKSNRFQLSPVAFGLAMAARQELPWLVVLRKDQIRLYPGRDGVGVGSKGQAETYFEIDLATVETEFAALLPLIFSAEALAADGFAESLLAESARYATELGNRLRERIYEEVVPELSVEVAQQLRDRADVALDADGLTTAYRVTLRILFRLLFQAYAEDRGLLPSGRNEGFDANSLNTLAKRLLANQDSSFGDAASLWLDLVQVWNAIDQGNPQWQIPAYNGGLFSNDPQRSVDGDLITKIQIPDTVMGPALRSLLVDITADGVLGQVDFRSLSVREFGTIYEGLLEASLSLAEQDLTLDKKGSWVPAKEGDEVIAPSGTVYFHTASGERKATGSYFTPKFVVDHLIERSIVPALTEHLEKVKNLLENGDAAGAAREFWDFRVADLAMGSGHFLVAAVDKIEALMRTFLAEHSIPAVNEELFRLAGIAKDALGTDDVAKSEVDEIGLLRRQVARRCIYGLDINQMAVELSRLALWIHTFVPGLPMSNLDHGLVCADSLTGIGTIDEALDALQPGRKPGEMTLFDEILTEKLASAKTLLIDLANASEANKSEVEQSTRLLAESREAADTARKIFDAAVAARIGEIKTDVIVDEESMLRFINQPKVAEIEAKLNPAHMPYLFPEVFLRDRAGFDVLVGNPPWEKVKIETHQWWGLRVPGLRGMPLAERNSTLAQFRQSRPDLEYEYQREVEQVSALNKIIKSGPFEMGSGDTDLYQAFSWRNWQLLCHGGRAALVLPRGAHAGSGPAEWRKRVISEGSFESVVFLVNKSGWVFEGVTHQYTIGLTLISKGAGDWLVRWAGPFANLKEFKENSDQLAAVDSAEFLSWSTSAGFPFISSPKAAEVFRQMRKSPRFDDVRDDWQFRPTTDLHATADKSLFDFDLSVTEGKTPIFTGASFSIWDPGFGEPYAFADTEALRAHLTKKLNSSTRNKKSAFAGLDIENGKLPMDRARIAFRDIARATDKRTSIACLIPPGVATVHQAPLLVNCGSNLHAEAFLLGVMASIPFDWSARRLVELHMTFEILNALPVPRFEQDSLLAQRVVQISGRLAAVDDRYADWAAEVGVPVGSVKSQAEKDDLIAELDALVSLLYGLSENQVEHVFETFHRGWDYQPRLDAVLKHYRVWRDKA